MDGQRRDALKTGAGVGIWLLLAAAGWAPAPAARAARADAALDPGSRDAALEQLGSLAPVESDAIRISVADVVEDGHAVPIAVASDIPSTEQIVIVIEENPYQVAARFVLSESMLPEVRTRVKMNRSTTLHALVEADGRFYTARRDVRVIVGGCGL